MKKNIMSRDPIEFDRLLKKWQADARKHGFHLQKTDLKRQIASNMSDYEFNPKIRKFTTKSFMDDIFK